METEQNFSRKARLGFNPLSCNKHNTKIFVEIISETIELFTKKDGETIDCVDVINMQSGEEQKLWLGGQLTYQLNKVLEKRKTLKGLKIEVNHKGMAEALIDGKEKEVNQYDIFELN